MNAEPARQISGQRHFAFEAAAWCWHFVNVVWLAPRVVVYWLWGSSGREPANPCERR